MVKRDRLEKWINEPYFEEVVCWHIHIHVDIYIHIYIHVCLCMNIYMYKSTYKHW
jgi:hypothetical protein